MDVKTVVGITAVVLNIIAFGPYIIDTLRGKTKPHMYSWFIWTVITGMVFVGQVAGDAGPGAWATGCTVAVDLFIFLLSLKHGTADITRADKICVAGALAALGVWAISDSLVLSIILLTIIDTLAFVPTVRKILKSPSEETFITYPISSLRCLLSIAALSNYSIITGLYPFAMLAMYVLITIILLYKLPHSWLWRGIAFYLGPRYGVALKEEAA
jgi:hypothetical protein